MSFSHEYMAHYLLLKPNYIKFAQLISDKSLMIITTIRRKVVNA
jgi:hypothetical protein